MDSIYVVFPYIRTSDTINIYGIDFFSNKVLSKVSPAILPPEKHDDIKILASMFFYRNNDILKDMVFAHYEYDTEEKKQEFIERLVKAHEIITFRYSEPDEIRLEPFVNKEYTNYYIFHPKKLPKVVFEDKSNNRVERIGESHLPDGYEWDELDGFEGKLNNEFGVWVTKGSRVYSPEPHLLLKGQDLSYDFEEEGNKLTDLCNHIIKLPQHHDIVTRIFTALKWYNRSISWNATDDIALVNMAIALEALIGLEQNKAVTDRFKEAIKLLTGLNNLEQWLEQFYNARSDLVHDGNSDKLLFYAEVDKQRKEFKSQYRSMVSYSRIIFITALSSIVAGFELSHTFAIDKLLKTNKMRYEDICRIIQNNKTKEQKIDELKKCINEILKYQNVAEKGLTLDLILQSLIRYCQFLNEIETNIPKEIKKDFDDLKVELCKRDINDKTYYDKLPSAQNIFHFKRNDNTKFELPIMMLLDLAENISLYSLRWYFSYYNSLEQSEDSSTH